ncbi:Lipid A biosynthesis lauroyl acyltransferase [Pirellulimonas nuda]|uniref:Lipid A biosynthesis lauroyl acyltransferase n=1 Tax=Pirellulimonas nuda TaxID=2528009 RepID=A0A518DF03_9BACT|nr:lysophospholipid acyltransferase family protein [Pirellulimonas nuda]QDU90053.1 Lipid A biosynthesis lauroyl acyltransferase [Pirellulimonas nuda]
MGPRNAADFAAYAALRVFVATIQALPLGLCDRGAAGLAWLFDRVIRLRRRVVRENLKIAFPAASEAQIDRMTRQVWRHLFLMVAEIAHAPRKVHRSNWKSVTQIGDERAIVDLMLLPRPKVIISGHYGNFELGGYLLGLFGFPTHTVARRLDNRYVDRWINRFRGRTGQHILPKDGSSGDIDRLMASGGVVALLGDQHAGPRGCWVNFFGKPASTHKAVALFSLGYQAPTLVMTSRRRGAPLRYTVELAGVADPQADGFELGDAASFTEWFTERLEAMIRRAPEQYWWVHRRWKGEPPPRAAARLAKRAQAGASHG